MYSCAKTQKFEASNDWICNTQSPTDTEQYEKTTPSWTTDACSVTTKCNAKPQGSQAVLSRIITKSSGNNVENVIVDYKGKYGMTQNAFGIRIFSKVDGENLKAFILGNTFKELIKATKGAGMYIDYRMFMYFRQRFWDTKQKENEAICKIRYK